MAPPPAERLAVIRWLGEACETEDAVDTVIYLREGSDVFVEGRWGERTCAASLQLGPSDAVARSLFFICERVPAPAGWEPGERPSVRPLLERYFEALNGADFEAAAACFSEDCLYSHPPYRPGEPQAEFHGRRELADLWPTRRGSGRVDTTIVRCLQSGNHAGVEGVAAGGSFLSTIVLDADGLIERYVAFYTPTLVPRLTGAGPDGE